ncbi:MAG: hypothetical protein IJ488_03365 [Clostridia bacterium]|nr:hypothetical protein [Clostridia bacterium]
MSEKSKRLPYREPKVTLITIDSLDVIRTSPIGGGDDDTGTLGGSGGGGGWTGSGAY